MFLGLFFFLIFGLFIGAVMFRLGRAAAPVSKVKIITIGSLIAVVVWGTALVVEYHQLPQDAARTVRGSFPNRSFVRQDKLRLQNETRDFVFTTLKADYPPGGFLGYIRWAATSGTMECPRILGDDTETHALHQQGLMWIIRVVISLLLIGFTLIAQFIGLAQSTQSTSQSVAPEQQPPAEE
jgi:hypothetical protein